MYLGIEIGGTKLQLGVGAGDGAPLTALERYDVDAKQGATGILRRIEVAAATLIHRYSVKAVACGFGGPVDVARGRVIKSHHVDGWDDFPLADWLRQTFELPSLLANDADTAGLAEALFGAGRGKSPVLYVTVGTGIGGGLIVGGEIYRGSGAGAVELGHLRPGLLADRPDQIVEALAAGWGIASAAQARLSGPTIHPLGPLMAGRRPLRPETVRQRLIEAEEAAEEHTADLLERCEGSVDRLTTKMVAQAAQEGNAVAQEVLHHAIEALGWAVAQGVTLLAPQTVVIGGGVSLIGEQQFFQPLREQVNRYVFPALIDSFEILPAQLGEEMVVHGTLALACRAK
jgi:glucokinase